MISVPFIKLDPKAITPSQANPGDAGFDLYAVKNQILKPFERAAINTGIALALPEGVVGLVQPRSGLALNHGIAVLNSPGTIDSGYRGEIKVILINLNPQEDFAINEGDRVAQLIIQEFLTARIELVDTLSDSDRGMGGFGSTGR